MLLGTDPLVALGVVLATAATDAVYVMFARCRLKQRLGQRAYISIHVGDRSLNH
jgi:hypothetical protein